MIGVAAAASFSCGSLPFIPSLTNETCAGRMTRRLMTGSASPGFASLSLGCSRCPSAGTGANRKLKSNERKRRRFEGEKLILVQLLFRLQCFDAAHNHQAIHRRGL